MELHVGNAASKQVVLALNQRGEQKGEVMCEANSGLGSAFASYDAVEVGPRMLAVTRDEHEPCSIQGRVTHRSLR